jgi:phosphohistidine phosphatase
LIVIAQPPVRAPEHDLEVGLLDHDLRPRRTHRDGRGAMMRVVKRLYLLRHAKSSWDEPGLADRDRPLAPRGERASKVMAEHLRDEGIAPQLVLCSPSKRTRETLARLGLEEGSEVRFEDELYAASAGDMLEVLQGVPDEVESVMVIGHNPGMEGLALELAAGGDDLDRMREKFPTAALAALAFDGAWSELAPGGAELVSFVEPKELSRRA